MPDVHLVGAVDLTNKDDYAWVAAGGRRTRQRQREFTRKRVTGGARLGRSVLTGIVLEFDLWCIGSGEENVTAKAESLEAVFEAARNFNMAALGTEIRYQRKLGDQVTGLNYVLNDGDFDIGLELLGAGLILGRLRLFLTP